MGHRLLYGFAAGAAGTTVLNVVTYLDMALRGRPSSSMPAEVAGRLAADLHLPLGADEEKAGARREGLGALLGFATGLSAGVVYGLARRPGDTLSTGAAGTVLGLAVMATSDLPMTATGLTDPRTWGLSGWLSDLVPHLAYGLTAAAVYDALAGR